MSYKTFSILDKEHRLSDGSYHHDPEKSRRTQGGIALIQVYSACRKDEGRVKLRKEKMHWDDPCIHPATAEFEILCKLWRLFSQPLVSTIRIKVEFIEIHSLWAVLSWVPDWLNSWQMYLKVETFVILTHCCTLFSDITNVLSRTVLRKALQCKVDMGSVLHGTTPKGGICLYCLCAAQILDYT